MGRAVARRVAPLGLAALLLAGCAPYLRTDVPAPRGSGVLDAIASLVTGCDEPRPGDPGADAPESSPGEERRERRRCATPEDRADGAPTPSPAGSTQRKP